MSQVAIIMGSKSDFDIMNEAIKILESFDIETEYDIVSAHRTPNKMVEYASNAEKKGIKVIIAGAGGAAHLPGMVASITSLPVIGVPIESKKLKGMDSLLSIVQMPKGIPVGSVAIGEDGAMNAGLYAASIIALTNKEIKKNLKNYRSKQSKAVKQKP